ncbi:MAG: nicotinate-nucleotide adenylyltransferase [Gammaproteobacteria bacterium]|nr:nicotinate-nucleotide adenylyltransferase [Gammaproteobacteria bacterium]
MLGILGGTFDPIHYGHLRLALEFADGLGLEEVLLVPAGTPPHRDAPVAHAEERATMAAAAVAGEPRLRVDRRELERPGPSYAVDTLEALRRDHPHTPLCFLMGMDAFQGLHHWHRWRQIPELAHIGIAGRPGSAPPQGPPGELLQRHQVDRPSQLNETLAGRILILQVPMLDISASRIRRLVATGRSPRYLLPDPALQIIRRQGLYEHES